MLPRPMKRICPSPSCSTWENMRRQAEGEAKGKRPSITRTRAKASQKLSLSTPYFLLAAPAPWPRKALKNSELEGSITMTSPFLAKLALYASRLR